MYSEIDRKCSTKEEFNKYKHNAERRDDMLVATIDTGTTNTRVILWQDKNPICIKKQEVGVRNTSMEGNNKKLLKAIRQCLEKTLEEIHGKEENLHAILASGMIGSELGVCEIPRVTVPVSIEKLAKSCVHKLIPEISEKLEICFIPGVQNDDTISSLEDCEMMDIMRGEEVETFAILQSMDVKGPVVLILPGSHTKVVYVNEENEIVGCLTTMAGEMLMELTRTSIISSSLKSSYVEEIEEDWLLAGAEEARKTGLSRTAFLVRLLDLFSESTVNQRANYLLGAILATDLLALEKSRVCKLEPNVRFIVGGQNTYSKGMIKLLEQRYEGHIIQKDKYGEAVNMAGYGAISIWEHKNALE